MRITNILARFLSLLDISILLLGMFVLLLSLAHFQEDHQEKKRDQQTDQLETGSPFRSILEKKIEPIMLYAGCEGEKEGRCFLLGKDLVPGREIDTQKRNEIEDLIDQREGRIPLVFLLSEEGAWDTYWTSKKLSELEAIWGYNIVRILNVRFPDSMKTGEPENE